MAKQPREFEYFGFDVDPIGKYKQPKPNPHRPEQGYPTEETDMFGTKTYGRYINNGRYGEKKTLMDARGGKAQERGRKFHEDELPRNTTPKTAGKR